MSMVGDERGCKRALSDTTGDAAPGKRNKSEADAVCALPWYGHVGRQLGAKEVEAAINLPVVLVHLIAEYSRVILLASASGNTVTLQNPFSVEGIDRGAHQEAAGEGYRLCESKTELESKPGHHTHTHT